MEEDIELIILVNPERVIGYRLLEKHHRVFENERR